MRFGCLSHWLDLLYDCSEARVSCSASPTAWRCFLAKSEYEDFSCCHRNNHQDCKKQRRALLSLPARLFFVKSIDSRPLEDYFSLLSMLFLLGIEVAVVPNSPGLTIKAFRVSLWTVFLRLGPHLPSLSLSQDWHTSSGVEACRTFADLHHEDVMIEVARWGIAACTTALQTVPVLSVCVGKVHPSIHEEGHSCVWSCARTNPKY